jgi:hypothetical protein
VDTNGLRQDFQYDSLGRLTAGWNPGRTKGTDPADVRYTYTVRRDGATAVTAEHVAPNGGYTTLHTLYDGLLRPETGRLERVITTRDGVNPNQVSDIHYDYDHDDVGKVTRIVGPAWNPAMRRPELRRAVGLPVSYRVVTVGR